MLTISPSLQNSYNYNFSQDDQKVIITFPFPSTFNIHSVEAVLLNNNLDISVKAPGNLPFLCGQLCNPAKSIELLFDDNKNIITLNILKTTEKEAWNIVIQSFRAETGEIDPKSAFLIFSVLSQQEDLTPEVRQMAVDLLKYSASWGYIDAMLTFGKMCLSIPQTYQDGFNMIMTAMERYQSPEAFCLLGFEMIKNSEFDTGYKLVKESLDMGYTPAAVIIGKLLSPFSELPWDNHKNPKEAYEILEKCDLPESKYERAKILYNGGDNFPANKEEAEKLYKEAKQEIPDLPDLESIPNTQNSKILIGSIALGILSVFGYLVFKQIRKFSK